MPSHLCCPRGTFLQHALDRAPVSAKASGSVLRRRVQTQAFDGPCPKCRVRHLAPCGPGTPTSCWFECPMPGQSPSPSSGASIESISATPNLSPGAPGPPAGTPSDAPAAPAESHRCSWRPGPRRALLCSAQTQPSPLLLVGQPRPGPGSEPTGVAGSRQADSNSFPIIHVPINAGHLEEPSSSVLLTRKDTEEAALPPPLAGQSPTAQPERGLQGRRRPHVPAGARRGPPAGTKLSELRVRVPVPPSPLHALHLRLPRPPLSMPSR